MGPPVTSLTLFATIPSLATACAFLHLGRPTTTVAALILTLHGVTARGHSCKWVGGAVCRRTGTRVVWIQAAPRRKRYLTSLVDIKRFLSKLHFNEKSLRITVEWIHHSTCEVVIKMVFPQHVRRILDTAYGLQVLQ